MTFRDFLHCRLLSMFVSTGLRRTLGHYGGRVLKDMGALGKEGASEICVASLNIDTLLALCT